MFGRMGRIGVLALAIALAGILAQFAAQVAMTEVVLGKASSRGLDFADYNDRWNVIQGPLGRELEKRP